MLTLLAAAAWACDAGVLSAIPAPPPDPDRPVVANGSYELNGVSLVGSLVTILSAEPLEAWKSVLAKPENQDEWHPAQFGTKRVERLGPGHVFQHMDLSVLWGAVHIRRHAIARIEWLESSDSRFHNCWQAEAPEPWLEKVAAWTEPEVEWNRIGYGGWLVDRRPEGGTQASYQFWIESRIMFPQLEAWASSRTLPDLMRAFDARAAIQR